MYSLRGYRVAGMNEDEIALRAINFCHTFNLLTPKKRKRYDELFESLSTFGITLEVMDDDDWFNNTYDVTIGHCDPTQLTITVPEKIYLSACSGDEHSLAILFHELGHLLLGHKPLLHFSSKDPTQLEDAEWQADTFAEIVIKTIGVRTQQLSIDYYK